MANALWQAVVRFDATKIAPGIALRNTLGIVLPLAAGAAMGSLPAGVVASLGALNVCYSDGPDPYLARARRMLLASVVVGIAVTAGALSARSSVTAVLVATLWAFAVGMLVVLGPKAGDLGAVTLVTVVIFAARLLTFREALLSGVLATAGGLLQTVLSVAVWPVRPHGPERRIIGQLYRTLAEVAVSPAGPESAPPGSAPISNAREALAVLGPERSQEAERLVFLLNQAERIRLSALTLRRLTRRLLREPRGQLPAAAAQRVLNAASAALTGISRCVEEGAPDCSLSGFNAAARAFREPEWEAPSPMFAAAVRDAKQQVEALAGQLRAAARLTSAEAPRERRAPAAGRAQDLWAWRARLYANLSLESTAFRHAVRLAVCVGLGDAIGRSLSLQRTYWLPMTIAIVLKPDFTGTFSRGILRIAGTLAGLALATVLYLALPRSVATDLTMLTLFSFALRWLGPANYGIFVTAMSGIVVLLIAVTGVDPQSAIVARAVNTSLGGTVALLAYWIWPTWERTRTGPALAEMLDAYRTYFHAVMTGREDERDPAACDAARLAARLARSNAEASVSRFSAEPGAPQERRNLLNEILVSSHAMARATMAVEAAGGPGRAEPLSREFTMKAEETLEALSGMLRDGARPAAGLPDLRAAWTAMEQAAGSEAVRYSLLVVETDRMATGLNTLREQVVKWSKGL